MAHDALGFYGFYFSGCTAENMTVNPKPYTPATPRGCEVGVRGTSASIRNSLGFRVYGFRGLGV